MAKPPKAAKLAKNSPKRKSAGSARGDQGNNNAIPGKSDQNDCPIQKHKSNKKSTDKDKLVESHKIVEEPIATEVNDVEEAEGDGIEMDINPLDDNFTDDDDEEDEVTIAPVGSNYVEEIPAEVIEQLKSNPVLKQYIGDVVKATINSVKKGKDNETDKQMEKSDSVKRTEIALKYAMKSPSDTTIYQPGLMKRTNESNEIISKISNFVEKIRLETSKHNTAESRQIDAEWENHKSKDKGRENDAGPSTSSTRDAADRIILNAEQLKAKLQPPKGKSLDYNRFLQNMDDDDEFFHVTGHINGNLRSKIAKGDFIDLELLLPKDRNNFGLANGNDDNRVELVSRDGHTYFKPIKENQITGLRRWEQAFRVYAAIYTKNNPERSGEIWQYIHTINLAASSF